MSKIALFQIEIIEAAFFNFFEYPELFELDQLSPDIVHVFFEDRCQLSDVKSAIRVLKVMSEDFDPTSRSKKDF